MGCCLWPCLDSKTCGGWNWDVNASGWQSCGIKIGSGRCYCNIFLFLAFPYSFELTYFLQRKCLYLFFYVSWSHWVVDVLSCEFQPTKMWNFWFCAMFFLIFSFFICFLIFLMLSNMKPLFAGAFDVMKSKWLRMFFLCIHKLVNVTAFPLLHHRINYSRVIINMQLLATHPACFQTSQQTLRPLCAWDVSVVFS